MRKFTLLLFLLFPLLQNCEISGDPEMLELILQIKNQNEELLTEVKSLQTKSDSLINEVKNSAAKQEELLEKVNSLQGELAEILTQINALTEQLNSQDADIEAIKSQLAVLQEKYQGILEQLEELQKLSQVLAEIETLKGQLSELDGKYEVILGSLAQNEEELSALKTQIEALQAQLTENLTAISELTSQLGDQGADIENILAQIEELKASCEQIKSLLEDQLSGKIPIPSNGLVGWWPFNGNANDESGNGNNGTVIGTTLTEDRFDILNRAYVFNGASNYISLENTFFNNPSQVSEVSYSFWINVETFPLSDSRFAINAKEGFWRTIGVFLNPDGKIFFGGSQPSPKGYFGALSSKPINLDNWNHVAITFFAGDILIYINGELNVSQMISYSSLEYAYLQAGNSTSTNYFGAIHPVALGITNFFKGKIDDFAIWNRALTAEEISKIYEDEGF